MLIVKRKTVLALWVFFSFQISALANTTDLADLIMINGQVRSSSGWGEAMAIRDGVIVAIGDNKTIIDQFHSTSEVIDLKGNTVLPGLHDMHVHSMFAGVEQFLCGLTPGAVPGAIAEAVKACVAEKKPGEWIKGGNWVGAVFTKGEQTKEFLDKVSPDNPVLLHDEAHHSIWVNSMALKLAGITRETPNPAGGIIERDKDGNATGLLRERAVGLMMRVVPDVSEELKRKALILSTNQMLSYGITSYTEASVRADNIAMLSLLSGEGVIKQHVRGCIVWTPENTGDTFIKERARYAQPRFKTDCVKIFMDGVPTESHTAAMLEPYIEKKSGDRHNRPEKGLVMISGEALEKAVTEFDRQGLIIKFHAVGDGAVRMAIDAVARAREINGRGGAMHHVGHSTFVNPADLPRVRDLQMAWEFSPYIWYPTPITADIRAAVGAQRMKRYIPIREAVETGALVVAGSDWSVIPSVNPWLAMETMVTRKVPGGRSEVLNGQEAISLEQAFKIFTQNGATLMGHRDKVGSIDVGMQADIIVTQTNPFKVLISQLHKTKVIMTFINGEKVFDAASPPQLRAP